MAVKHFLLSIPGLELSCCCNVAVRIRNRMVSYAAPKISFVAGVSVRYRVTSESGSEEVVPTLPCSLDNP